MTTHGQTEFYLERMQRDWLPQRQQHAAWIFYRLTLGLVVGVVFGFMFGLFGWLSDGVEEGLHVGLRWGVAAGLVGVPGQRAVV